MGQKYLQDCHQKIRYESRPEANAAIAGQPHMNVYRCEWCEKYHVRHARRRRTDAEANRDRPRRARR